MLEIITFDGWSEDPGFKDFQESVKTWFAENVDDRQAGMKIEELKKDNEYPFRTLITIAFLEEDTWNLFRLTFSQELFKYDSYGVVIKRGFH